MTENIFKGKHDACLASLTGDGNYKFTYDVQEVDGKSRWEIVKLEPMAQVAASAVEEAEIKSNPRAASNAKQADAGTVLSPNVTFQNMSIVAEYAIRASADVVCKMIEHNPKGEIKSGFVSALVGEFLSPALSFMSQEFVSAEQLLSEVEHAKQDQPS